MSSTGSPVVLESEQKPAFDEESHCIGVRHPARLYVGLQMLPSTSGSPSR